VKHQKIERDHNDVLRSLELIKEVSKSQLVALYEVFGPRLQKALEIFHTKEVVKYVFKPSGRYQWVVEGKEDYLIYEKAPYCSCDDFFISVMNGEAEACKHLIAQKMAEITGWHRVVTKPDISYNHLMDLWRGQVFSENEFSTLA